MQFFSSIVAEAHCDIPCGVYDPTPAKIAAKTVARMVDQITEMEAPNWSDKSAADHYINAIGRRVAVKEAHAEICKRELGILWSDFFQPEHLEKFPNLHNIFWRTIKLAGKCKQEINPDAAARFLVGVDEIAQIFYQVKKVPERFKAYQELTDNLY